MNKNTITEISKEELLTQYCLELAPDVGEIIHHLNLDVANILLAKLELPPIKIQSDYKIIGTHYLMNLLNIIMKDIHDAPSKTHH